jgi:ParB/RepB/Spo0J family partition protein
MSETISLSLLKPHPRNVEIYGEEDVSDLAARIRQSNWIKPLVITQANVIISGHRRWQAAKSLGLASVPAERRTFANENEELEALLLENASRDKTVEQKVREALIWEEIEREKARLRQQAAAQQTHAKLGRGQQQPEMLQENFPEASQGQSRDAVAARVGFGTGRTYQKAAQVVAAIDAQRARGNEEEAQALRRVLNEQSVDAAKKLVARPEEERTAILKKLATGEAKKVEDAAKAVRREQAAERGAIITQLPTDLLTLMHGDFREKLEQIPDESADLVFTDPPYHEEHLPLWSALAEESNRILKPGGLLIAYSGQRFFNQVMGALGKHLDYYWLIAIQHTHGQLRFWDRQVWNSWKPIVVFAKGKPRHEWFNDFMSLGDVDTKGLHDWSQPLAQAEEIIHRFSPVGGMVIDPMCGAATIPIAAAKRGRQAIGIEIDEQNYQIGRDRAQEVFHDVAA